jgi:hypothetical protein
MGIPVQLYTHSELDTLISICPVSRARLAFKRIATVAEPGPGAVIRKDSLARVSSLLQDANPSLLKLPPEVLARPCLSSPSLSSSLLLSPSHTPASLKVPV